MCLLVMRKQSLQKVKQFINLSKLCKPHRNRAQPYERDAWLVAHVLRAKKDVCPVLGHVDFPGLILPWGLLWRP